MTRSIDEAGDRWLSVVVGPHLTAHIMQWLIDQIHATKEGWIGVAFRRLDLLVVPIYCLVLVTSLTQFLENPDLRWGGIAWNALFQIFGPTIGSFFLVLFLFWTMATGRIARWPALGLLALLLVLSSVCVYWAMPVLFSV